MPGNRLQKLLLSEYSDFEDVVLIESPFAQTTREGRGIRQVHLGITPTKIVLATDTLLPASDVTPFFIPGIDPEIETFELVAIYPVECVTLSVFHRRRRKTFKARFVDQRVLYFELGGLRNRKMFWNLWCERIKNLSGKEQDTSRSETSVATSTSNSTMYLVSKRTVVTDAGVQQIWCKFGAGDFAAVSYPKWIEKNIFLGKSFEDATLRCVPDMMPPTASQFIAKPLSPRNVAETSDSDNFGAELRHVNRFAEGIEEGCTCSLFLPAENYIVPCRFSRSQTNSMTTGILSKASECSYLNLCELAEASVRLWENYKETVPNFAKLKHKRRYAFTPQPHFLFGLGPWNIPSGSRYSVQVKRAASSISIRRQPIEPELRLPVSRRQLTASISSEALQLDNRLCSGANNIKLPQKGPVVFFWTPEYWYRPRSARDAYQELRCHLSKIREYQNSVAKNKEQKNFKKKLFRKKKKEERESAMILSDSDDNLPVSTQKKRSKPKNRFFSFLVRQNDDLTTGKEKHKDLQETSLQYLKRILRLDMALTAWDFDSTTLANQLTLIDKELFLKIPSVELGVLVWQQSSKNAPNIGALVAFSHRISCLVASEVLRDDSEKIRARLVARFINTAEKCNKMCNFQSCKSILCGLQSPSVYRLYSTWSYVRKRHATRYQAFENLCRLYRDPRLPTYQRAFSRATQSVPYLPWIGDLIARLLDKIPDFNEAPKRNSEPSSNELAALPTIKASNSSTIKEVSSLTKQNTSLIQKLFSSLRVWPILEVNRMQPKNQLVSQTVTVHKRNDHLVDLYSPLHLHRDNRMKRLEECIELLEKYQRAVALFSITVNEMAKEYLLKARYREDRDNFLCSFSREDKYLNVATSVLYAD